MLFAYHIIHTKIKKTQNRLTAMMIFFAYCVTLFLSCWMWRRKKGDINMTPMMSVMILALGTIAAIAYLIRFLNK